MKICGLCVLNGVREANPNSRVGLFGTLVGKDPEIGIYVDLQLVAWVHSIPDRCEC